MVYLQLSQQLILVQRSCAAHWLRHSVLDLRHLVCLLVDLVKHLVHRLDVQLLHCGLAGLGSIAHGLQLHHLGPLLLQHALLLINPLNVVLGSLQLLFIELLLFQRSKSPCSSVDTVSWSLWPC